MPDYIQLCQNEQAVALNTAAREAAAGPGWNCFTSTSPFFVIRGSISVPANEKLFTRILIWSSAFSLEFKRKLLCENKSTAKAFLALILSFVPDGRDTELSIITTFFRHVMFSSFYLYTNYNV